jgi:hypothetical protein
MGSAGDPSPLGVLPQVNRRAARSRRDAVSPGSDPNRRRAGRPVDARPVTGRNAPFPSG